MTVLSDRMRALAAGDGAGEHERAEELRARAMNFDKAAEGFYATPQRLDAKGFAGAWARARKLWCEITGEPLV